MTGLLASPYIFLLCLPFIFYSIKKFSDIFVYYIANYNKARFFWLVDRVEQQQLCVAHIPGIWNIADHFTKPLPKPKFYQFFPYIVVNLDNESQEPNEKSETIMYPKEM